MRCFVFQTKRFSQVFPGWPMLCSSLLVLSFALTPLPSLSQQQPPAHPPVAEEPEGKPLQPAATPAPVETTTAPALSAAPANDPESSASVSEASALPDLTMAPTLVPMPKDPPDAQEVEVPAKSVAIVSGDSTWDDSIVTLSEAFKKINAALEKAGKKAAGRPIAVFTKSTDDGFSYDAMIPLAEAPAADAPPIGEGIRYGTVPPGKALRFIHKDPYELISMTYEGVALYMENKNLVSKDELIEEYVTDITDQADRNTIVNIYVELTEKEQGKDNP